MVCVAVAGGTGGLGRTIVEALAETGAHDVLVLTRKHIPIFVHLSGVKCLLTNYEDETSLKQLLKDQNVHTIISALNPPIPEVFEAEIRLIQAAAGTGNVKRFVPSQFAIDYEKDDDHLPLSWKAGKQSVIDAIRAQSTLEYTLFLNGYFMDYFGIPHAPSHMIPEFPYVDIPTGKASIPGSGDVKVTWTHTKDVARFITEAVNSGKRWPEKSVIVGDKASFNEIVALAEEARGFKFKVTCNSIVDLRNGKIADIPAWLKLYHLYKKEVFTEMFSAFGLAMALGDLDFQEGESLNKRFPDVRTMKLAEFIRKCWTGR